MISEKDKKKQDELFKAKIFQAKLKISCVLAQQMEIVLMFIDVISNAFTNTPEKESNLHCMKRFGST